MDQERKELFLVAGQDKLGGTDSSWLESWNDGIFVHTSIEASLDPDDCGDGLLHLIYAVQIEVDAELVGLLCLEGIDEGAAEGDDLVDVSDDSGDGIDVVPLLGIDELSDGLAKLEGVVEALSHGGLGVSWGNKGDEQKSDHLSSHYFL